MKKIIILSLGATTLLLAIFGFQQARQRATEQARLAATEQALAETAADADRERARGERELARLQEVNAQLADKARVASQHPPIAVTNGGSAAGDERKRFQNVHKDPEMKEAMRRQARQAVERTVKQLVTTNLIQRLGLTEPQTAVLRDLLARKGTLGFDFMMPLMSGELDETDLAEAGRRMKAAITDLDAQVKSLLGEERFRDFDAYERAQPDRERADKFAAILNDAGQPMTGAQQEQLLAALSEERSQFHFTTDYSDTTKIDFEHFKDYYAEDRMNAYFDEMTQLNERLVRRAQAILSPEQVARFEDLLRDQILKSKYVVKTTNALIGKQAAK
jgi:hypothetical protein